MQYILAIDLGTSGPKVALLSIHGEIIDSEFEEVKLLLVENGGAEQSPDEWWRAIDVSVKRLLSRKPVPSSDIIAIASTTQWSGTVAVDKTGKALGNAIIWMDSRGVADINTMIRGAINIEGYGMGKLLKWINRTGGAPGKAGKDPIAHILYLKRNHPDLYRQAHTFLEPVDYLGAQLTGNIAASYNSIVIHWLTDNRNINHIHYDKGLLRLAKIDAAKLPELKPANSVLGVLSKDIARDWGLNETVQVIMGSPDVHSAIVGSGAVKDYEANLYVGTSSWLICHVPFKKTDLFHNLASLPSAIPGRYLLTNEQECAGVNLQFLRDNIIFHTDECATPKPANAYELFNQMAARVPPGSDKLIFTPWLYGERTPIEDPSVRGGFFNQSLRATREHYARAVMEGVAYNSRWLLQYVENFIGKPLTTINFTGGGAQSDLWCQIFADIFDRPIRQIENPMQSNARGAALLASAALGYITYEDIGKYVSATKTYTPNPSNRNIYDGLFREFLEIYKANKKIYARLNNM